MVGEGVDDGAGAADVGWGGGEVFAFAEEGGAFVGWGLSLRHVGVWCLVFGVYMC